MMKNIALSVSLFCATLTNAQTGVPVPELVAFDNAMNNFISTYNVPGAQLAITYQGRLVYNRGFGLANTATQDLVYPHNLFRIASVSKPVTGVACIKLMEDGLLDLDAKVFGPEGILNDEMYQTINDNRYKEITVRMLLHHTGGWNRNISGDPMFNAYNIAANLGVPSPPSASDVVRYILKDVPLNFNPGTQSHYSNVGYCVLGRVIEKVSGQSYEDYVRSTILAPLGITEMQLGKNRPENRHPDEVRYYDFTATPNGYSVYDNSTLVPWPDGGFNVEFMDAHGGWIASAEDLLKFMCGVDKFDTRPDILSAASIDTFTKPSPLDINYACGIAVNTYNNWWHTGSMSGTASLLVRNGNEEINWAIVLNSHGTSAMYPAMDLLVWNILPNISIWPEHDLFSPGDTTGTGTVRDEAGIFIYPNPSGGVFQFSVKAKATVTDLSGKIVVRQEDVNSVDLSGSAAGIYLLTLSDDEGRVILRRNIVRIQE